jgi:HAD superfamily hydrolase (TIGR01490 family)
MAVAAFFDLDKTIIAKSSALAFTKPLYRAGYLSRTTLAKAAIGQAYYQAFGADHGQMERVKEELSKLTAGWRRDEIVKLVDETVDQVVTPLVYSDALTIIDQHRRVGRRVVVISSSPEEIVVPLCRYLAIDEVIATRAEIDDDGRYTGEIAFYAYGPAKAEAIREMAARESIDLPASFAYSDSVTDLPMLEAVGNPVAVNPDSDLLKIATERDWEIRWFESAVTLRDRVGKAAPGVAIAGGIAAAAVYVALKRRKR